MDGQMDGQAMQEGQTEIWPFSAGSFLLVGVGYCRGPRGGTQRVNGRARAGFPGQAACANACTTLDKCGGFAFVWEGDDKGECWLYGEKLDEVLTEYAEPVSTTEWEGYTKPNFLIGDASKSEGVKCFLKPGVAITVSPECVCTRWWSWWSWWLWWLVVVMER